MALARRLVDALLSSIENCTHSFGEMVSRLLVELWHHSGSNAVREPTKQDSIYEHITMR